MSKRSLATAAEGLPSLTRRLFLRGAAVAAPLVAVPALAAAAKHYAEENPALLALEPELDAAHVEMQASVQAYKEALRVGSSLWPRAPEAIALRRKSSGWLEYERDITGAAYDPDGGLRVYGTKDVQRDLNRIKRWRKITPDREEERRHFQSLYAQAEDYEKACFVARSVSSFPEAVARRETAAVALKDCIHRVHSEEAKTMAGVRIKAAALRAWENAPRFYRMFNPEGVAWAPAFARSVLEIMEG